jgi:hypothetical protein
MRSVTPVKNRGDSADGEAALAEEGRAQPSVAAKAAPDHQPPADRAPDRGTGAGQGRKVSHGLEQLTWEQIMLAASDRCMDPLVVTDCNRNEPGLQSARFWDHINCH